MFFYSLYKFEYGRYLEGKGLSLLVLGLRILFMGWLERLLIFRVEFFRGVKLIGVFKLIVKDGEVEDEGGKGLKEVDYFVGVIVVFYGFYVSLVWESDIFVYRVYGDKRFGMVVGELLKELYVYDVDVEVWLKG